MTPKTKVAAAGIGGAATTILLFILTQFSIEVPGDVGAAIATVISFAAGFLKAE
jgi:hypothetical protein